LLQSRAELGTAPADLTAISFENSFVETLPGDPDLSNVSRAVSGACYTPVDPTPVPAPRILGWADAVGAMLGISRPELAAGPVAEVLGGNRVLAGMKPYAARYGGHQFGNWAGQLGDGRAITLAEVIGPDGQRYDLQLKGAGPTPYSRTADGRAVLRSSVREFMCSEAMHYLGVPTTRALSLVGTGQSVVRDMFYDGNPEPEPGAIVCRVAPSFVRFGNFEILAAHKEIDLLKQLADYVIGQHFSALPGAGAPTRETYASWFEEICRRTALMAVEWMRVGFVHGVMNTDNMSILGLTMDYGPYGWLEGYDPQWTPNTTDAHGRRYCYGNQPNIAQWNLIRLANALYPLIEDKAPLERGLGVFADAFESGSGRMFAGKLGLLSLDRDGDDALLAGMFDVLAAVETDVTIFYRQLAAVPVDAADQAGDDALVDPFRPAFYTAEGMVADHTVRMAAWLRRYAARVRLDGAPAAERRERMNRVNPKYVLRNYLAQQSIDALAEGDASFMERVLKVLQHPYDEQPGEEDLASRRPEWARNKAGCSALSCSS
jgi:uncharacterized protein YdiU (UPF0061 family)